jgi:hypothetical protein
MMVRYVQSQHYFIQFHRRILDEQCLMIID